MVGDRGRIVVPHDVRTRAGLSAGTPMVLVESSGGLVLITRQQLRTLVQREMSGLDLVEELLADRRRIAEREDVN